MSVKVDADAGATLKWIDSVGRLRDLGLDGVIKLIGAGTVLIYVIGLIVVQLYLLSVGVSDFGMVRTRFILTGALTLLPLLLLAFLVFTAVSLLSFIRSNWKAGGSIVARVGITLFGPLWFVLCILLGTIFLYDAGVRYKSPTGDYLLFTLVPVLGVVLGLGAIAGFIRFGEPLGTVVINRFTLVTLCAQAVFFSLLAGFLYLDFFANSVFPIVPEQFGGGRPRSVEVVFPEESATWARANGLMSEGDTVTKPLLLLWETDAVIVLRDSADVSDSVIQVNRDDISAVIIDPIDPVPSRFLDLENKETPTATPE